MYSAHDTLCHEPENLTEGYQFHGAVCIALVPDYSFVEAPTCVVSPINKTLLEQPGVLVRPDHPIATLSSIPESEHADIESMDELKIISCDFHAVSPHPPALSPFLQPFNSYELGREDGLDEERNLVQCA